MGIDTIKIPAKNQFLWEWKAEVGEEVELLTVGWIHLPCNPVPSPDPFWATPLSDSKQYCPSGMNLDPTETFVYAFLTFCIGLRRAARRALRNSHSELCPVQHQLYSRWRGLELVMQIIHAKGIPCINECMWAYHYGLLPWNFSCTEHPAGNSPVGGAVSPVGSAGWETPHWCPQPAWPCSLSHCANPSLSSFPHTAGNSQATYASLLVPAAILQTITN